MKIDRNEFVDLFDVKGPAVAEDQGDGFKFAIPQLPPVITEVILPWALTVGCLGFAGFIAVSRVLALPGKPVGLGMVGAGLLLYAVLIVPLTLKGIYSAAVTAKLRLPNVVWFQTFSLAALPMAGLIVGYDVGGVGPTIVFGVLGLLAMSGLMAFMFRADVMQTMVAAFYAASGFVASTALCVGILIGVGLILDHAKLVVPWGTAPVEVAAKTDKPAEVVVTLPATEPAAAPVVEAPKVVAATQALVHAAPVPVVPVGPPWLVPVESVAAGSAWPTVEREVRASIEVVTPLTTAHAAGGAPFVAFLQPKSTAIYDLRTGRQSGFIKAAFEPRELVLSADGKMLAGVETAQSQNSTLFPSDAAPGSIEVWSTSDNRLLGRVPGGTTTSIPTPLGFAGDKLIASGSSNGMSGLQVWDAATSSLLRQWNTPLISRSSVAISNSGKFVAVAAGQVIRTFNLQTGDIAGELPGPASLLQMKGMAFSPDGKTIAAIVPGYVSAIPGGNSAVSAAGATGTLLEWNVADGGKLMRSLPIDMSAAVPPVNLTATGSTASIAPDISYLQWTPDGGLVRADAGLFEITSGRAIYTPPAQTSGNLSGQLISIENKRSMYEFLPTGVGTRLVLKTVDLPNVMVESAIASAKASTQGNSSTATSGDAFSGSSDAVNAMMWPTVASSTSPAPQATEQIAAQGQWDVRVRAMMRADPAFIQKEQQALNAAISQTQSELQDAKLKLDNVSKYRESVDANGQIVRQSEGSGDAQTSAQNLVTALQQRLHDQRIKADKLDRAATAAPNARNILAALDSGTAVHITTDSDGAAAFADGVHPGDHIHVTGSGQISDGILVVKMQSGQAIDSK